jgi:hypothetical protein
LAAQLQHIVTAAGCCRVEEWPCVHLHSGKVALTKL